MSAYVIVEIDIKDPTQYEEYKRLTPASIAKYNGRFVVRGGQTELLEGDWNPKRIVILEFADKETAKKWWDSPEYRPARDLRQRIAITDMIIVDGAN
jgi:uncharacterized protein (DUF1330 family)